MQKRFTFIAILMFGMAFQIFSQTIVGTDPEDKNVVLEEFTGIHCVYCPEGHAIAQAIYDAHPDDVVLINIHTGSYASPGSGEPDFRTPWGSAIAAQSGLIGYPAGTVNRHLFPGWSQGSGTAMSRGQWNGAANQIMATPSYLNVGAVATITPSTRELSVDVEVYYTGDSPEATNYLNVAILQNDILGPQTGGGSGNNYHHMHMLRHLLTDQWGVEINQTTEGSLYSTTLTYTIPEDYNDVAVILDDLDIVAFVSETHQEVVSGTMAVFAASSDYDVAVSEVLFPTSQACDGELSPRIKVKNYGGETLTSLDIEYAINDGDVAVYHWTGELHYPASEIVELPPIEYSGVETNDLVITLGNPNGEEDENPEDNTSDVEFGTAAETSTTVSMELFVGASMAYQISWELKNGSGEVIAEGSGYSNNTLVEVDLPTETTDCYDFFLYDSGENGFSAGGYLKLYDDGELFAYVSDELQDVYNITFHADLGMGINEITNKEILVYPNPVNNLANISYSLEQKSTVAIDIYSLSGTLVYETPIKTQNIGEQNIQINTTSFEEGIYFVTLNINGSTVIKKLTVIK